ncbi:LAMI_0F04830g1_1 [Lachancea mirantina]|uniref:LAMI_0F04830g1_1 n=1 Tax=Lachancea mirantina TaxID=1230905 RepID=A0A1G4JY99_9SACH|nr:LAMI_0F04830g1_1 [Lachancea mirantina]
MISPEAFDRQLSSLIPIISKWRLCVRLDLRQNTEIGVHCAYVHSNHPNLPDVTFEISIQFNPIYQEPFLTFRIWKTKCVDGFEKRELWFPSNLSTVLNTTFFQIGLDYMDQSSGEAWFQVHCCDTNDITGQENDKYLKRWFSVYLTLFDERIGTIFQDLA